jgi:hypothetical protein
MKRLFARDSTPSSSKPHRLSPRVHDPLPLPGNDKQLPAAPAAVLEPLFSL